MRVVYLMSVLLLISCANTNNVGKLGSEGGSAQINFDVKEHTLSNGLKVFVVENHKLPIFSYYTFFKVGGKHESDGITGASHFLEHMMFKGAKKYGVNEFDENVEGNGGTNNAYTTNDMTVYYEKMPSEHINLIIDIEADRMGHLLLEPKGFEKERKVVLEERKMRYENSDRGKIYLNMMKAIFEGTPYGTSVIGKVKDLESVTRDQFFDFFQKFYAPNNAFIFIVGDVDADEVFDEIDKKFGDLKKNEKLAELKKEAISGGFDFKGKYDRDILLNGTSVDPMFMLAFKGIKVGPREAYVLDILSSILGDGQSSYLNKHFVLGQNPKTASIYAANYTLVESGVFFIGGQLLPKVNMKTFKKSLLKKIQQTCSKELTERSLQKVKNQYLVSFFDGLDTNDGIASFLGNRQAFYGNHAHYNKEMEIYNSITLDEVQKSCEKYLNKKDSIYLTIWKNNPKQAKGKN